MAQEITSITPMQAVRTRMVPTQRAKAKLPKMVDQIRAAAKAPMTMPLRMMLVKAVRMKIPLKIRSRPMRMAKATTAKRILTMPTVRTQIAATRRAKMAVRMTLEELQMMVTVTRITHRQMSLDSLPTAKTMIPKMTKKASLGEITMNPMMLIPLKTAIRITPASPVNLTSLSSPAKTSKALLES